jgi:hypothetical protein
LLGLLKAEKRKVEYGSGVDVFKMLGKPKAYSKNEGGSTFIWSDLWRYFKVTYKASQEQATRRAVKIATAEKEPQPPSKFQTMAKSAIEVSFYFVIVANFALWGGIALYIVRRRRRNNDAKKVAQNSRLDRVMG